MNCKVYIKISNIPKILLSHHIDIVDKNCYTCNILENMSSNQCSKHNNCIILEYKTVCIHETFNFIFEYIIKKETGITLDDSFIKKIKDICFQHEDNFIKELIYPNIII